MFGVDFGSHTVGVSSKDNAIGFRFYPTRSQVPDASSDDVFVRSRDSRTPLATVSLDLERWARRDESAPTSQFVRAIEDAFMRGWVRPMTRMQQRQNMAPKNYESLLSRAAKSKDQDWSINGALRSVGNTLLLDISVGRSLHGFYLMRKAIGLETQ